MEALQFKEIRDLLNACNLAKIEDQPTQVEKGCWELYRGSYRAHVLDVPFEVLYFFADATRESVKRAAKSALVADEKFVVYAPSAKAVQPLRGEFASARGFWSTSEYLASFMANELEAYRASLEKLSPLHYVDPIVQPPSGTHHRFPNPVGLFLSDPQTTQERDGTGSVAVVLAEAGHGKTYMCEWLVAKLASLHTGVLPIYVSSTQWQRLRAEDLSSLGTTILSSFRALGTPISWVEGHEELFLRVALKAGLFRVVFDGFDEYVLRTPGGVSATDTLGALASLAAETGTRVVVTSRTSFWDAVAPTLGDGSSGVPELGNVSVYRLSPFDANLARNYFRLRFPHENQKVERAVVTFNELSRDDPTFAGRGFVLLLIADLVESGAGETDADISEKPLIRLMRAHCDRERRRQQLPLTSQQQIDALRYFVFEVAQGEEPTTDLLNLSIQIAAPELRSEDVDSAVEKMIPHALIVGKKGRWSIRQPQVEVALLAMHLLELSKEASQGTRLLTSFSNRRLDPGVESDLAAMLTSLCTWNSSLEEAYERAHRLVEVFFAASGGPVEEVRHQTLRRLATLIALRIVDEAKVVTHRERAELLGSLFPAGQYQGVVMFGGVARFDWSGTEFVECVFDNVRWSNCTFDAGTVFRGCHLLGGSTQHCRGFDEAQWLSCFADDSGRQFRDSEAVLAGKKAYTEELLKRDATYVLEKLLGKGGVGFRTIEAEDLAKGRIAASAHKTQIVDAVKRHVLEEHHISGGSKIGVHVRDSAREAVRALFSNNVWVGDLATLLSELKRATGAK